MIERLPSVATDRRPPFVPSAFDRKHDYLQQLVTDRIGRVSREVCSRQFHGLRSIILTGSLARNEATILSSAPPWRVAGDAELLLISADRRSLPGDEQISAAQSAIEAGLARSEVLCPISLAAATSSYLRRLKPHIFGFELRRHARVLGGDASLPGLIPDFTSKDIPLEDGWRLLSNRIAEHVEIAARIHQCGAGLPPRLHYHTVKMFLDMATSLSLFIGAYTSSYRARQEALKSRPAWVWKKLELPFPRDEFINVTTACMRWKLDPQVCRGSLGWDDWRTMNRWAVGLWRWELERLTGLKRESPLDEVMRWWAQRQAISRKIRAWANVVRFCGFEESRRNWWRWLGLKNLGTPRDWTYRVAFELFSRLPNLLGLDQRESLTDPDLPALQHDLPVGRACDLEGKRDWRRLAEEVALNYHLVAERTTT